MQKNKKIWHVSLSCHYALLAFLYCSHVGIAQVTNFAVLGEDRSLYEARSIVKTPDNGYVVAGYVSTVYQSTRHENYQGLSDIYVAKVDYRGNIKWENTIGGKKMDEAEAVIQTSDGGFAIAGYTKSFGEGNFDVYIVKLDGKGETEWTRTVGGKKQDKGYAVIQTSDGGYIVAGSTKSFGEGNSDAYIVKLTDKGEVAWTRTAGGKMRDESYAVIEASDGGYVAAGETKSSGEGDYDMFIVKLDDSGSVMWKKTVGDKYGNGARSIIKNFDGGYTLVGYTYSSREGGPGASQKDIYMAEIDKDGNHRWTSRAGGPEFDEGYSLVQTENGNYIIAGHTKSYSAKESDVFIVNMDDKGQIQWTRTAGDGDTLRDVGYSVCASSKGNYMIAGATNSLGTGPSKIYLVKVNELGYPFADHTLKGELGGKPWKFQSGVARLHPNRRGRTEIRVEMYSVANPDSEFCKGNMVRKIKGSNCYIFGTIPLKKGLQDLGPLLNLTMYCEQEGRNVVITNGAIFITKIDTSGTEPVIEGKLAVPPGIIPSEFLKEGEDYYVNGAFRLVYCDRP